MSDITVSQLPTKTQLLDADMVVIDDGAQSYKMYYAQFKNLFRQAFEELFVNADGDTMNGTLVMDGVKVVHRQGAQDYPVLDRRDIPGGGAVGYPDRTAVIQISSGYVTPVAGWIDGFTNTLQNSGSVYFNGVLVWEKYSAGGQNHDAHNHFLLPIEAGVTITTSNAGVALLQFMPNK